MRHIQYEAKKQEGELKLCPFCGVKGKLDETERFYFFAHNPSCFLFGDRHKIWLQGEVERWNRRQPDSRVEDADRLVCADCGHCKPDTTDKLRYCKKEYMGFPFPNARTCPGFRWPDKPTATKEDELPITTEKEIFDHNIKCKTVSYCGECAEKDKEIEKLQLDDSRLTGPAMTVWGKKMIINLDEKDKQIKKYKGMAWNLIGALENEGCDVTDIRATFDKRSK